MVPPKPRSVDSGTSSLRQRTWSDVGVENLFVSGILLIFVLFGVQYAFTVPIFEAPDEIHHYAFARHLSMGNSLPVQTVESDGPWEHEGTQAPLYYFLLGRLIAGIDQSDFEGIAQVNPHANLGDPLYPGNKNRMLYSAVPRELAGANLAAHIGRLFSLLLAVGSLLFVYALAKLAFTGSTLLPIATLAFAASIPQFNFISATVSNDNLVVFLSSAVLYWLVRLITIPESRPIPLVQWIVLGILLGLAALSKLQGLGLIFLTATTLGYLGWRRRQPFQLIQAVAIVGSLVLLIAGWWYLRNFMIYGEWLGVQQLLTIDGLRTEPRTMEQIWGELRGVRYSFWGLFGWFSILLPDALYVLFDLITGLALSGLLVSAISRWRRRSRSLLDSSNVRVHLLLVIWASMLLLLLFYWLTFATSGQGRLLFPAIGAISVLMISGLNVWVSYLPRRLHLPLLALLPLILWLTSFYVLTNLLPENYEVPMTVSEIPPEATPIHLNYDNKVELVAVEIPEGRFHPGDQVHITLYMRALEAQSEDYELFVQLLDNNNSQIANVTSHPGWGTHPLSLWDPGQIYRDSYRVHVTDAFDHRSPLLARVYFGFIDPDSHAPNSESLLPVEGGGPKIDSRTIGYVEIMPFSFANLRPLDMESIEASFADTILLTGYRFPRDVSRTEREAIPVTLFWEARGSPSEDYTAFVHLTDSEGNFISTYDQPPAQGRFPTSFWKAGDKSLSEFPLTLPDELPDGTYELWVGMYPSNSKGENRVPVTAEERIVEDSRVLLGSLEVP